MRDSEDISDDRKVALGFECPLFIPVPENVEDLGKARVGEGDHPWSAGAGCELLAIGLAESTWVFRRFARGARRPILSTLEWGNFHLGPANLFVWEAFVSGKGKSETHTGDAEVAARAFLEAYPDIEQVSRVTCESPMSLAAAAMGWARVDPGQSGQHQ